MTKLIGKRGPLSETRLDLEEGIIGRDPEEATLVLEDASVSRQHVKVSRSIEGFTLENLSETNPALINGEPMAEPHLLKEGDEVQIGETVFGFTEEESYETLFETPSPEEREVKPAGRWLLKVIGGPNSGAEFALQAGKPYLLGTDANTCDLIFNDLSVSRQHARLQVSEEEKPVIEDLHSRNGVMSEGQMIAEPIELVGNQVISLGTTSFVMIDREGVSETIIAALPPEAAEEMEVPPPEPLKEKREKPVLSGGAFIILLVTLALIVVAVAGTLSLFKSEEVVVEHRDYKKELEGALVQFPDVRYSFNQGTGRLFLVGHVLTPISKSELLYNLEELNFISMVDDNVVVDQYIWDEYNALISRNPDWKGVSIHSPSPGLYVMTGYLKTQTEAASLQDFIRLHFPYLDQFENQVVVEQLLLTDIFTRLQSAGLNSIEVRISNGEVTLNGYIDKDQGRRYQRTLEAIEELPGVRLTRNYVVMLTEDGSIVDITGDFKVQGSTKEDGKTINVLVDGKIISRGSLFQGMEVVGITQSAIILEKNEVKYKIRLP